MGGRSKIISNLMPPAVVDLSDNLDVENTVDDNIFHFLPDNEDSEDEEEKGCNDAEIRLIIKEARRIERRWRTACNNTNLRGRGTSRSTYFAEKKKTEKLIESGRTTQQIANFFTPRQLAEQSATSEVAVPPLSAEEPDVVQENDTGNETDDEVIFGVAAE